MTLPSSEVQDLTLQHMQGKCASQYSSLPKAPYKLFRSRMIKREGKNFQICLGKEPLTDLSDLSESFKEQKLSLCFQNHTKPKFLSMNRVRRFESKLFHFLITQDILVDTWKFASSGEAWNNLYADFQIKETNLLSR